MLEGHNRVPQAAHDRIDLSIPSVFVNLEPFGHFGGLPGQNHRIEAFPWTWNSGKKAKQLQAKWGHGPSHRIRNLVSIGEAIYFFGKFERNAPILETLGHGYTLFEL